MLAVLSPAKSLDETSPIPQVDATEARFPEATATLAQAAAKLKPAALAKLMHISKALAEKNAARFQDLLEPGEARPALYTFDGDVYTGLQGKSLDAAGVAFAQHHVRILSGLYGVLRPLDLMRPYRLEMGTDLKIGRKRGLYTFWGKRIAEALADDMSGHKDKTLINLASKEYFAAVDVAVLPGKVLAIDFRDDHGDGDLRFNTFVAKKARGAMARFIVDERLESPAGMKKFDGYGYSYRKELSDEARWAFVRTA
ncbi:peroxide stress protein YaaA [Sphingosinicellaceae bacterium]|nr:peroxide stress protein YaaA [Sphingosinicellaceae bacterium]